MEKPPTYTDYSLSTKKIHTYNLLQSVNFLTGRESFLPVVDMDELAADSLGVPHPCLASLVGV